MPAPKPRADTPLPRHPDTPTPWWKSAVFYQIYIRSFADSNRDGIGDFGGIISKLDHITWLGIDAVWLNPFFPSPQADHGYDVSDYTGVEPAYGTMEDFDRFLGEAHKRGIRVIVDLVPNHTSSEHPWFRNALSDINHPDRDKYLFRTSKRDGSPPNNWESAFGGPAWTFHKPTNQWYLNMFASEQPDLNWRNPDVQAEFEQILRFWLDSGADGFRIDVAHALFKDDMLRDSPPDESPVYKQYMYDQPEVHEIYRTWRKIVDSYPNDRLLVGEVYLLDPVKWSKYLALDELHLAFNFLLVWMTWEADAFRHAIQSALEELSKVGSTCAWVLSNHDVVRHVTRFGGGEKGLDRARAALFLLLGLPGPAFIYQGEELGLEQAEVPDLARQDPTFKRTKGAVKGRDGCRVPIPWAQNGPGYGFTEGKTSWLPLPKGWGERSAANLEQEPDSILNLYRQAIAFRHGSEALQHGAFEWLESPKGVLAFKRIAGDQLATVLCNFDDEPKKVVVDGRLALASSPNSKIVERTIHLPENSAAWLL